MIDALSIVSAVEQLGAPVMDGMSLVSMEVQEETVEDKCRGVGGV